MNQKELSNLPDQALLKEAKKLKSRSIINALLIGFLVGVIIYSVVKNTYGFLTLIPLYFIYKMINSKNDDEVLKAILKEKGLEV